MQSIILAAGLGSRLSPIHEDPKILLEIGGITLLERHLLNLVEIGVDEITICLGYKCEMVADVIRKLGLKNISAVVNPDFQAGSVVSLWATKEVGLKGQSALLLDGDVLYHPDIIKRLATTKFENCLLIDRNFEEGDEPVKVYLNENRIVELRKILSNDIEYDTVAESVGFFKFSPEGIQTIYDICKNYMESGQKNAPHEEVIRDCIIYNNPEIKYEDVTSLPWIEIDFPEDVKRAQEDILPRLPFAGRLNDRKK